MVKSLAVYLSDNTRKLSDRILIGQITNSSSGEGVQEIKLGAAVRDADLYTSLQIVTTDIRVKKTTRNRTCN